MSLTVVPNAPAGVGVPGPDGPGAGTLSARLGRLVAAVRHSLDGTPGRLRLISALAVLAAVLVAIGGGAALRERSAAIDAAAEASAHLVLVQRVQTDLVQADADATNAYLGFGLEPENERLDYISLIKAASHDLAIAAQGSPQDAAALGTVNAELTRYTGYIGSSRANNRQNVPVGADYLKTASALLNDPKTGVVQQLSVLSKADQKKIDAAYSRSSHAALWLALIAVLGLGALIAAQIWLTRHSRRYVNLPLAAATLAVLIGLVVGAGAMAVAQSRANDVRHGALSRAVDLSNSRVAAFAAKSSESLTLIDRGSATKEDTDWNAAFTTAKILLPAGNDTAAKALVGYANEHAAINKLDVDGSWKAAVDRAIKVGPTTVNAQFGSYEAQTANALDAQAKATASGLSKAGNPLLPAGILIVLIGLLAAVGAWWGVTLRLDEYR